VMLAGIGVVIVKSVMHRTSHDRDALDSPRMETSGRNSADCG